MPTEETAIDTSAQPPEDFTEYQAWRDAGGKLPDETESEAKPADVKTEPAKPETAEDSETSEEEQEDKEEEAEEPKPAKGKGGFQKKIDKLTREKYDLEAANKELAGKLAKAEPPAAKPEAKPVTPAGRPKVDDFENYEDYTDKLTDWKIAEARRVDTEATEKRAADKQAREAVTAYEVKAKAFAAEHSDYEELVLACSDVIYPDPVVESLMEAGPALIYHLVSNRAEAERIAKLPAASALRELGKIEAALEAKKQPAAKPKLAVTGAPKPVKPLSGGATEAIGSDDGSDYNEWAKKREAELRARKK